MRKNKKEKPITRFRWADFQVVPEDFENEVSNNLTFDRSARISLRERIRFSYLEKLSSFSFKMLIKRHNSVFYDLGPGDFDHFTEHQRFQPRAVYLLKNQWVQVQLGVYVIEYTIIDGVAYSYYSLNYGISYHLYMETQLSKQSEMNLEILVDLFKETEEFLHDSIVNGSAPYFPNFRIK
ncbi:hypothetical protein MCERE85_00058 [Candidatus Nanopelagicaceae bacterium]